MSVSVGQHKLGPDNATLSVRTKKGGAASKAGHNLLIEVTSWSATLDVGADQPQMSIELSADSSSMKVIEGTGGVMALGDTDKTGIAQTIKDEVLKGTKIEFRSSTVAPTADGDHLKVTGELDLAGKRMPARVRAHGRRRWLPHRQRNRQAEQLGHEAVLGAVRDAQGAR